MACGAPELEAPDLLHPLTDDDLETYFLRQPNTADDLNHAVRAARVCCVNAVRYGGQDPAVIALFHNSSEFSDFIVDEHGRVQRAAVTRRATATGNKAPRWWQFWRRRPAR